MIVYGLVTQSCLTLCGSMDCKPTRFLCPWNFPGKNTGVGYHSPLQGIFPTQGSNLNLLHFRQILYSLSHQGSPQLQVNKLKRKILSLVKNDEDTDSWITCFYLQILTQYISVQFCHLVMSDSLLPHGLQHIRLLSPLLSLWVGSNSYLLSQWCHPTISSFVVLFSSCPQSFPESGPFTMNQSSYQVAKVMELQLQHQSFQWIFRVDFL